MSEQELLLEYNSARPEIAITEYGRNVQKMIEFCKQVADRDERNKVASAIISVMGQLCPYLRDIDDFEHKLWDHMHIMANFELDVDSPYPVPKPEELRQKPERLEYPDGDFKYSHYGKSLERLVKLVAEMDEGEDRNQATIVIANLMKKHYVSWNRGSVEDMVILKQLKELSGGKLSLADDFKLAEYAGVVHKTQIRKKKSKRKKSR